MKTGLTLEQLAAEITRQQNAKEDYVVNTGNPLLEKLELASGHFQKILVDFREQRVAFVQVCVRTAKLQLDRFAAHDAVAEDTGLRIFRNLELRLDREFDDHVVRALRIVADVADRADLIAFDDHRGRRLQTVHLIVGRVIVYARREQVGSLEEIDAPVKRCDHQYSEKTYLEFSAQFQFHAVLFCELSVRSAVVRPIVPSAGPRPSGSARFPGTERETLL